MHVHFFAMGVINIDLTTTTMNAYIYRYIPIPVLLLLPAATAIYYNLCVLCYDERTLFALADYIQLLIKMKAQGSKTCTNYYYKYIAP